MPEGLAWSPPVVEAVPEPPDDGVIEPAPESMFEPTPEPELEPELPFASELDAGPVEDPLVHFGPEPKPIPERKRSRLLRRPQRQRHTSKRSAVPPVPREDDLEPIEDLRELDEETHPTDEPTAPYICSRCGQPSEHPLCEACQEAFTLLRAFSGLE